MVVPGSKSMVGNRTAQIGTWESHGAPAGSVQQAEEARRTYGGMAVGLTHIRGVAGVTPGASRTKTAKAETFGAGHSKGLAVGRRGLRRRMPYTEMETQTPTKLALISQRARREPYFQFTSLAHLLDVGFLKGCYFELGRDRASGIDGVSWSEYGEYLDENLEDLVSRMKAKHYKPQPVRRVYIPKDEHSRRPLGLPALEDKIVQKGIARILEAIYEADFLNCSYGFRPGRSCHQAINSVDKTVMT